MTCQLILGVPALEQADERDERLGGRRAAAGAQAVHRRGGPEPDGCTLSNDATRHRARCGCRALRRISQQLTPYSRATTACPNGGPNHAVRPRRTEIQRGFTGGSAEPRPRTVHLRVNAPMPPNAWQTRPGSSPRSCVSRPDKSALPCILGAGWPNASLPARAQPPAGKGFRGYHHLSNRIPLRCFDLAPHSTIRSFGFRFESESRRYRA